MEIKKYKPTSPGRRMMTVLSGENLTKKKPEKRLVKGKKSISGRGNTGRITVRFRGGGHKRKLRKIDFIRNKLGVSAKVAAIEYDPNRSARIALLYYFDGEKRYILAPNGLVVGDIVLTDAEADIKPGNHLQLKNIPLGSQIHNIELRPGKGGQLARSAGVVAHLVAKDGKYAQVKMPSSETRMVNLDCYATLGQVGNVKHELIKIGKAGRSRWLGRRPHNRGVSMNPVDHPLGGGEGKTSGGRHPVTPWGVPTKGYVTRKNKRTEKMIIKRRK